MAKDSGIENYFADNYLAARRKFLDACAIQNLEVKHYVNNCLDNQDVELTCDVTLIGDAAARKLLVLTSGVHGAELMCGSGCQTGLLIEDYFSDLPADNAVLIVHALNPWGALNLRRNNENNVDLCRNFVDFENELPINEGYESIHDALGCAELSGSNREQANKILDAFKAEKGETTFVSAVMSGQYSHPQGMAYGGNEAVWSQHTIKNILQRHAGAAERVCLLDYHSGLGPYAVGTVVCLHKGEALQRAQSWFGDELMAPMQADKTSDKFHPALGHTTEGYIDALPGKEVTSIVIEYGTYDMQSNLQALLDEHSLYMNGDYDSVQAREIKDAVLKTHYPDDPQWRYAVWSRSKEVIEQAMRGLNDD